MPLASAIQTFLCGGSRLPFGSGIFQSRHALRLPLSLRLALVAMVTGTVGSPLDCEFRGISLCAWPGLSWCPPVASLVRDMLAAPLLKFSFSCRFFEFVLTLAVMVLLFGAVCSVSLVLAQFGELVWTGQEYIFATLEYMRWAPYWIKLKPEDFKKQIGKLAEKYDALVVVVTLEDGFGVPQVKLVTGIKFLRILRKENLAPPVPEVLYFLVKKAKSMRKHLDRTARTRFEVPSHLR